MRTETEPSSTATEPPRLEPAEPLVAVAPQVLDVQREPAHCF